MPWSRRVLAAGCSVVMLMLAWAGAALAEAPHATPERARLPRVEGQRPRALAPFAAHDPLPRLTLVAYPEPATPRQVAESFVAHLAKGYNVPGVVRPGAIIGGESKGYELAWSLLAPGRPALADFQKRWEGTVALQALQLELADGNRFFVEVQRVEHCGDHWAVSFYAGALDTVKTPAGWRVRELTLSPEDLVGTNIAGHQGWQHDEVLMAKRAISHPPDESWAVDTLRYERRTVTLQLHHPASGEVRTVRLARTMDGSWAPLAVSGAWLK